jgi:ubiquinone/menaquinone biosynthesis C-methylase UbiE
MTWPQALFDEAAHAGLEHLDPASVAGYDRKAGFEADAADEVRLLRGLGLDERSTLIDLGAGTGTLALTAATSCRRVIAVDVSPAMLAAARERAARGGVSNVEFVEAGFLSYQHKGQPADVVYSRNALHHVPDFWKAVALERIASMLHPGGILRLRDIVFAFDPGEAARFIEAWLDNASQRPEEGWTRAELAEHLRDEHSTFTWLLEPMLERAGFEVRAAEYGSGRIFARYVCVKAGG